jgi:hypothetical protein
LCILLHFCILKGIGCMLLDRSPANPWLDTSIVCILQERRCSQWATGTYCPRITWRCWW